MDYYNLSTGYLHTVMERINKRFTAEEVRQLDRFLQIVGSELMPEVAQNGGTA